NQLAAERHPLLGDAGCGCDRGSVLNTRRRQQGLARPQRQQLLLSRSQLAFLGRVAVEGLETELLQSLRIVLQLRRTRGSPPMGLVPAPGRPLKVQSRIGQRLPGRFLHLLAQLQTYTGVLQRLLDSRNRVTAAVVVVHLQLTALLGQSIPDRALSREFLRLGLCQFLETRQGLGVDSDRKLLLVRLKFLASQLTKPVRIQQRLRIVLVQPRNRRQLV